MTMKATKQTFLSTILNNTPFKFLNGVGFLTLSNNRTAKVTIEYISGLDIYNHLSVSIINNNTGIIDSNQFYFNDELECDKKNVHKMAQFIELFINSKVGWDWYIDYPTNRSLEAMQQKIVDYIRYFDDTVSITTNEQGKDIKPLVNEIQALDKGSQAYNLFSLATIFASVDDYESDVWHQALSEIQNALGQTDGGLAGLYFDETAGEIWNEGDTQVRINLIAEYIRSELNLNCKDEIENGLFIINPLGHYFELLPGIALSPSKLKDCQIFQEKNAFLIKIAERNQAEKNDVEASIYHIFIDDNYLYWSDEPGSKSNIDGVLLSKNISLEDWICSFEI